MNEVDLSNITDVPGISLLPPWLINLQLEVRKYHPQLIEKYDLEGKDYTEVIACLAAEVNIVMDGMFTQEDLRGVCEMIMTRLRNRRSTIIIPDQTELPSP